MLIKNVLIKKISSKQENFGNSIDRKKRGKIKTVELVKVEFISMKKSYQLQTYTDTCVKKLLDFLIFEQQEENWNPNCKTITP